MKIWLAIFCAILPFALLADLDDKLKYEVGYFIHHEDYDQALEMLFAEENKKPGDAEWNFFVARCYYDTYRRTEALGYFKKADSLGSSNTNLEFYLADLHHQRNEFDQAKSYYLAHKEQMQQKPKLSLIDEKSLDKRIYECENGIEFLNDKKDIPISNLGDKINTEFPDYAPVISADEQTLFFTSRRPNSTGNLIDASDGWNMEDIYFCVKDSNNQWTAPQQMPGYINSNGHDANIGLSPDGQKLFIYRDDELETGLAGDIYVSDWKYRRWSTPMRLPEPVNSRFWETGVSTTPDENTLYFSSNRPGGYGGLDIYSVRRLPNGEWARPQNLGPNVNTEYNEESPFIHPDGKRLYFSSEGHNSMGGFDIFYSERMDTTWSGPENLGFPLNTAQNELYFVLTADARKGYFSGIREETFGDKDLYLAILPERPVQIILLKGQVVDMETEQPLATLIKVFDNSNKELISVLNSNAVNGRFSSILPPHKNYNVQIEVEKAGYAHSSINIHVPDQKEFVQIDTTIRLQRDDTIHVVTLLPNIFFKLDVAELDSTSELELDALARRMFQNPNINLEIAVHTYSQPGREVNKDLSQKRADAIKQALVERGIAGNRIFPVGYGDRFPKEKERIAWEKEGKRPDDRVEAIIIPSFETSMNPDSDGFYYVSNYEPFDFIYDSEEADMIIAHNPDEEADNVSDKVESVSIEKDTVGTSRDDTEIAKTSRLPLPALEDLRIFFVVNKIYFRLDPDSVLGQVIETMNANPDMDIIVHAYTDTVGHPDYNILLSKFRADHVKSKLVEMGISSERIETIGHGEVNPIWSNATRAGRMKNRRAEFEAVRKEN